jgi:hypothetical protein
MRQMFVYLRTLSWQKKENGNTIMNLWTSQYCCVKVKKEFNGGGMKQNSGRRN